MLEAKFTVEADRQLAFGSLRTLSVLLEGGLDQAAYRTEEKWSRWLRKPRMQGSFGVHRRAREAEVKPEAERGSAQHGQQDNQLVRSQSCPSTSLQRAERLSQMSGGAVGQVKV